MYAKDRTTIVDRREMLRVKVNSLALEARLIRRNELRSWGLLRDELHRHRVFIVRREARSAHLALGFIKGRSLAQMEAWSEQKPDWKKVRQLLKSYGAKDMVMPVEMPEIYKQVPLPYTQRVAQIRAHFSNTTQSAPASNVDTAPSQPSQ